MPAKVSCFVAYPSKPPSLAETIERAISRIEQDRTIAIYGWKSTSVGGKFIITSICRAIEQREVFICDLTNLNHNVLFELGYAIAKKKRIWILLDPNIEKSKVDYEKFRLLTTVGYVPYSNSHEIVDNFYKERPYEDLESTIYKNSIESVIRSSERPKLLYLKSAVQTDASIELSRRVSRSRIPSIEDDPEEVRMHNLSWYAQKVYNAHAVIAHFLRSQFVGSNFHNAKTSFVSGLAYGFGKPLLMLAHETYESPIDYRELLEIHETAVQCEKLADYWLSNIEDNYAQWAAAAHEYDQTLRAHSELQNIAIGDPIAEHESDVLLDYFVRTSAYTEALASKHSVFVGRKGSGKTAIFYKLAHEIASDSRNHVCIIKPIAYELEGILRMLQQALPMSEKGYLIESFWKFLIYTELAKTVFESLNSTPPQYRPNHAEEALISFVEQNALVINPEFSMRLDSAVTRLQNLDIPTLAAEQRLRISELLHSRVIGKLRSILGEVLEKKNKVAILVDNLDKAWSPRADMSTLCNLLFGLLGVSRRISQDFERSDIRRKPVNLSLVIFLRSDIFTQVIKYARERDKIPCSRIVWDDQEVLLRVLEDRFLVSSSALTNPSDVWSRYFCTSIKGVPTREYLVNVILPRPRDLIYLTKNAISRAVNRRHTKVEEEDVLEAQKGYSQYALDSIVVENSIQIEKLEALLYEFVGSKEVINSNNILEAMKACGISESKLDEVIELLCDLTFLGREAEENRFEFLYNEEAKGKLQVMARKTAEARADKMKRFRINEAFHAYLEIVPTSAMV